MKLVLTVAVLVLAGAVGSEESKVCLPHSRPWQVRLQGGGCSGALINELWIVTSFSCSYNVLPGMMASLGEHNLGAEEGTEQRISIADVIRRGPYRSPLHSLAMVRLSRPAQINQYVQPLPLPTQCPQPGEKCSVSGWGSTDPNQYDSTGLLKCLSVPIVGDRFCESTFPDYIFWSPGMVCAGSATMDNCLTDGGAVLECDGQLQGVQWFEYGCSNPSNPSVYSKICLYNSWINDVMEHYIPPGTTPSPDTTPSPTQ